MYRYLPLVVMLVGCPQSSPPPAGLRPQLAPVTPTSTTTPPREPKGPHPQVVMETSLGTVKMELFHDVTPTSTKNFLTYVDDKFYDGTIFHRVIPDFMIQGGGMNPGVVEKPTRAPIVNESGLSNKRGTLAMARTDDPDSATAQFYINVVDNPGLDAPRYAVFGRVTEGMDVVDKIRSVRTGFRAGHKDVPLEDVLIKSIRRLDTPKEADKAKDK